MRDNARKDDSSGLNHRSFSAFISSGKVRWLGLALAASVALTACTGSTEKVSKVRAAASQIVPVSVANANLMDMPVYLVGLGSVTPLNSVSLKSRVDGQLESVAVKEGQMVRKGQLLALIDPRPFQVQLDQGQAALYRDQALLRDAKLNYERFKQLLQVSGAMSQQQVDTQASLVDQYQGAVRTDQAAIDNAKLQLVYCRITSPIDGRVGLRLIDPGNIVHAADPNPMLVITQLQPITVIFTLPEDQLPTVAQHMKKGVLSVDALARDNQTLLASGKLLTIDNQIDQTTGTGRLKAQFNNPDNSLWPNQFVNVRLMLETRKNSTVIPSAAVLRGPQGTFVYVVKPDKTVEVRPVTVSLSQNNQALIASGLGPGESVVTDGQDKLQGGSKVEPRVGGPPAGGRPPGSGSSPSQSAGSSPS